MQLNTYIDLFSGCGSFHKGMLDAGFSFKRVLFSEIDKYAIANYKHNYPNAEYAGSVEHVHIERADIITFGWPCQDNSIAGNRKGHAEGTRSNLLTQAVRIIAQSKPSHFIAENVPGLLSVNEGVDFIEAVKILADLNTDLPQYDIEMQVLNTAWFLPQNRERLYFIGHRRGGCCGKIFPIGENGELLTKKNRTNGGWAQTELCTTIRSTGVSKADSTFDTIKVESAFDTDSNSGAIRATIGKMKADDTYIVSGIVNDRGNGVQSDISNAIDANYHKGMDNHAPLSMIVVGNTQPSGKGMNGQVYDATQPSLAPTLSTNKGEGTKILIAASRGRGNDWEQQLEVNESGNSNTITGVQKDNLVIQINPSKESNGVQPYQQNRIYDAEGISPALNSELGGDRSYLIATNEQQPSDKLIELTSNVHEGNRIVDSVGIARTLKSEACGGAAKMGQYKINDRIRRLTPVDCERLQGLDDFWTAYGMFPDKQNPEQLVKLPISDAQRYKLCGNAVTRNVVEEIAFRLLQHIKDNT